MKRITDMEMRAALEVVPFESSLAFWRDFTAELGVDINFEKHDYYPEVIRKVGIPFMKQLIRIAKHGLVAYRMVRDYGFDREWAEDVVTEAKSPCIAFVMVNEFDSDRKWAEGIIEEAEDGYAAYWMVRECGSDREWAERIITEEKNAIAADEMATHCGSSEEWAEGIKVMAGKKS